MIDIINKVCSRCHTEKPIKDFAKDKNAKDGRFCWCRACKSVSAKKERLLHKEDYNRRNREYRKRHPERIYEIKHNSYMKNREYYLNQTNEYAKKKCKTDINFRIAKNLRERMRLVLRGNPKAETSRKLVGLSWKELKAYLEGLFQTGMTWKNYGKWHIDHIKPCNSFNLVDKDQQKECFHYTNLQPLWAIDNARKGVTI